MSSLVFRRSVDICAGSVILFISDGVKSVVKTVVDSYLQENPHKRVLVFDDKSVSVSDFNDEFVVIKRKDYISGEWK